MLSARNWRHRPVYLYIFFLWFHIQEIIAACSVVTPLSCVFFADIQFSQDRVLKRQVFPHWMVLAPLSKIIWPFMFLLWSVALQASLSMEFSRQVYWNGFPFPAQGVFLTQGSNPRLLNLLHCRQTDSFTTGSPGKPWPYTQGFISRLSSPLMCLYASTTLGWLVVLFCFYCAVWLVGS